MQHRQPGPNIGKPGFAWHKTGESEEWYLFKKHWFAWLRAVVHCLAPYRGHGEDINYSEGGDEDISMEEPMKEIAKWGRSIGPTVL